MAPWCLSVIVLFCAQQVIARDCSSLEKIMNCNECIRCGGTWCNVAHMNRHCGQSLDDSWCPNNRELLPRGPSREEPGSSLQPALVTRTVLVGSESETVKIVFDQQTKNPKPIVSVSFVNDTSIQTSFDVRVHTECRHGKCAASIFANPTTDFCRLDGSVAESVAIKVKMEGLLEEALVQYQVPCACGCSQAVEKSSQRCNGNGDYSCGACSCRDGWHGRFCDEDKSTKSPPIQCQNDRGDIPEDCIRPGLEADEDEQECSGKGRCHCGKCECFSNENPLNYFNRYCENICVYTAECDHCLLHPTPGLCSHCDDIIIIENTTRVPEGDKWAMCNMTRGDCMVRYAAMRDDNDEVRVIVLNSCHAVLPVIAGPVNITVPIVLGIVAILAATAAVAGFMAWKNRTPPLPMSDPQYTNIGAEDCTGINPLYKPPTSSFKNPTYGKS